MTRSRRATRRRRRPNLAAAKDAWPKTVAFLKKIWE
jgi:hypothetical protein